MVVVAIVSSTIYGYRKGFFRGLISALSCFFSFLIANFFGRFVLQSSVFGAFNFFNLNELVSKLNLGSNERNKGVFDGFLSDSGSPVLNYLIFWILIFILIFGFKQMFKKLFFLTGYIKKIPIVNQLDGLLGGVFGALEAAVFLVAVAFGCFIIILLTKNSLKFLNSEVIGSTKLFFMFYKVLMFVKFHNFV